MTRTAFNRDDVLTPQDRLDSARKCLDLLAPEVKAWVTVRRNLLPRCGTRSIVGASAKDNLHGSETWLRSTRNEQEGTIPCSHCGGAGRLEFTGIFADTLRLLKAEREPINGADLARKHGVNPTAMNNRLVWLETRGLAKRERYGRESRWTVV